jgi:hypothetical protein
MKKTKDFLPFLPSLLYCIIFNKSYSAFSSFYAPLFAGLFFAFYASFPFEKDMEILRKISE